MDIITSLIVLIEWFISFPMWYQIVLKKVSVVMVSYCCENLCSCIVFPKSCIAAVFSSAYVLLPKIW